jgi:hypothetical protein
MITSKDALISLRPGAQWSWSGTEYSGLNWLDTEQTKPTPQEINTEIERLKQQELSKYYQQLRVQEYPPLSEFADAMYWQSQGDDSKMTAYLAACEAVKLKYPKDMAVPESVAQAIDSVPLLSIPEEEQDNG